jgi:anti-sigma regulatory factor (Ser/Thr protein kinase)
MIEQRYPVGREDYSNAGKVSSQIKSFLKQIGLEPTLLRRIAVACYEAEINMIIHSYGGEVLMAMDENALNLTFKDIGPGIPDIPKAMTAGWSTANEKAREFGFGAGMGLPNILRMADTFELNSSQSGTNLHIAFKVNE